MTPLEFDVTFSVLTLSFLFHCFSCFVLRTVMGDKRQAAMAGLTWPATTRSTTDSRASGLTPPNLTSNSGTSIRPPDPADSEMR